MAKVSKKSKAAKKERRERRFEPASTHSTTLVKILGALGAMAMGAGAYGQFAPSMRAAGPTSGEPVKYAAWILASGALILGAAIWMGTSSEPAIRVGDGGVGTEKGGLRRLAWWTIESIGFSENAVRVVGTDDTGTALTIVASLASQPQAAAWIVKEARARVPDVVDIPDDVELPDASKGAGEVLVLEPPQVVGKRCAESDKVIAYEPDARVCPRCERVYHRAHVPDECACGASLTHLQARAKDAGASDAKKESDAAQPEAKESEA